MSRVRAAGRGGAIALPPSARPPRICVLSAISIWWTVSCPETTSEMKEDPPQPLRSLLRARDLHVVAAASAFQLAL
eukprot:12346324-Alexandrium_andersonii.AAC.1